MQLRSSASVVLAARASGSQEADTAAQGGELQELPAVSFHDFWLVFTALTHALVLSWWVK